MSAAETILSWSVWLALLVLAAAFLATVWRVIKGPTLADRVVALDMLTGIAIGFIALIAIRTGFTLYIDIAIALGLVGFLATVAFARFILSRGTSRSRSPSPESVKALAELPPPRGKAKGKGRKGGDTGTGPAVRRKGRT